MDRGSFKGNKIMRETNFSERLLILIAFLVCAAMVGYQALYHPQASPSVPVYAQLESDTESEEYQPVPTESSSSFSLISLNSATQQELQERLPGIGEKLAQRIVEYREQHGGFQSLEELKNVEGIGDKMLEKIKPYLSLS